MVDGGAWRVEGGRWRVDVGQWRMYGQWMVDAVDGGWWTVDSGRWTVDGGRWTVEGGRWTVEGGWWTVDSSGWWMVDGGWWMVHAMRAPSCIPNLHSRISLCCISVRAVGVACSVGVAFLVGGGGGSGMCEG